MVNWPDGQTRTDPIADEVQSALVERLHTIGHRLVRLLEGQLEPALAFRRRPHRGHRPDADPQQPVGGPGQGPGVGCGRQPCDLTHGPPRDSSEYGSMASRTCSSPSTVCAISEELSSAAILAKTSVWYSDWFSQTRPISEALVTRMPVSASTRSLTRLKVSDSPPPPSPSSREDGSARLDEQGAQIVPAQLRTTGLGHQEPDAFAGLRHRNRRATSSGATTIPILPCSSAETPRSAGGQRLPGPDTDPARGRRRLAGTRLAQR